MAKISNTSAYPNITSIDGSDYLIITDKENTLMTKSCTILSISNFSIDRGLVKLIAPGGAEWKLVVDDAGVLSTELV